MFCGLLLLFGLLLLLRLLLWLLLSLLRLLFRLFGLLRLFLIDVYHGRLRNGLVLIVYFLCELRREVKVNA